MSRDRAAYMRAYRAKNRGAPSPSVECADLRKGDAERIAQLEAEVAHLNRRLSLHHGVTRGELTTDAEDRWVPEFRPVPKPGPRK